MASPWDGVRMDIQCLRRNPFSVLGLASLTPPEGGQATGIRDVPPTPRVCRKAGGVGPPQPSPFHPLLSGGSWCFDRLVGDLQAQWCTQPQAGQDRQRCGVPWGRGREC